MSNTNAPLGLKPIRRVDGSPWNGATSPYRIASGYAANIFTGDPVILLTTGYINISAGTDVIQGIFMGCSFTDANGVAKKLPYWPTGQTTLNSADAIALVLDDPNIIFEGQFDAAATQAAVGANFDVTIGSGTTATGLSTTVVSFSSLATSAKMFRFLRFVDRVDNDTASSYARGEFLPNNHRFRTTTGI